MDYEEEQKLLKEKEQWLLIMKIILLAGNSLLVLFILFWILPIMRFPATDDKLLVFAQIMPLFVCIMLMTSSAILYWRFKKETEEHYRKKIGKE